MSIETLYNSVLTELFQHCSQLWDLICCIKTFLQIKQINTIWIYNKVVASRTEIRTTARHTGFTILFTFVCATLSVDLVYMVNLTIYFTLVRIFFKCFKTFSFKKKKKM